MTLRNRSKRVLLIVLCASVITSAAGLMYYVATREAPGSIPVESDIEWLKAESYGEQFGERDISDFVVPRDSFTQILKWFRGAVRKWNITSDPEYQLEKTRLGILTIKTRARQLPIRIEYFLWGNGELFFSLDGSYFRVDTGRFDGGASVYGEVRRAFATTKK